MATNKYTQILDGEWIRTIKRGYSEQCCDCGLVHDIQFRIVDGRVEYRAVRNNRATAACCRARRKKGKR